MKSKPIKFVLFSSIVIMSIFCFISVNLTTPSESKIVNIDTSVNNAEVRESKLPDLKLIKTVVEILGKFTTAH